MAHGARLFSIVRLACVLGGLLLAVSGSFYLLESSAQTVDVEKPVEQNLVNGRLAFTSLTIGMGVYESRIGTVNPDGTGLGYTSIPLTQAPGEQAWSPDGTKFVYVLTQTPVDIYVANADGGGRANLTNTPSAFENNPSWGANGKIAYERAGKIWTMNADGSGQAEFSAITQASPSRPAWSSDGAKLAFVSGGEIWVINADGTNQQRVTTNTSDDYEPAWSPDGSKIVFAKGGSGISVINLDGTNEIPLTMGGDTEPSWSPDGTKIAFTRDGIYTMDANGANQFRIIANIRNFPLCCDTSFSNPAWQPVAQTPSTFNITGRVTYNNLPVVGATVNLSGTTKAAVTTDAVGAYQFSGLPAGGNYTVSPSFPRHYFTPANRSFNNLSSNQTGNFDVLGVCQAGNCVKNGKIAFTRNGEILTINPDGTGETNITNNTATDNEPSYSPNGANVVFTTNRDGNNEIYRMDSDGSSPVRLTNNTASDFSPNYSPDGATIVFVSARDGNNEIYKMNADGSNQVRLTNNMLSDFGPVFMPGDGQKIIYVRFAAPTGLFTMNVDGSNQQPFPAPGGISPTYERLSYSPDGSKLMLTYSPDAGTQIRTTWTMNADGGNPLRFPADGSFGTYSPDGSMVAYTCCIFDNTNRLRVSDALGGGASVRTLTPSNTDNGLPDWQPLNALRPTAFDFDGDGRSDVSVFRPSDGVWHLLRSQAGYTSVQWGLSTDVLTPADYDGDLKTDIAVWRPTDGYFYVLNSFDNTVRAENFGLSGDIPTGGDWDADGKADPAVYRAGALSYFYYRGSMGNPQGNITFVPWGTNGDKPVVGDYDGDGRADAAVYRGGNWYILRSSNGQLFAANFGLATDVLTPADYDADGKTDLAVFRDGIWYQLRSTQGFAAFQFGLAGDVPTPADYDGDGRADVAIYRNGIWWILKSQSGAAEAVSFGLGSDKPIPSAVVR